MSKLKKQLPVELSTWGDLLASLSPPAGNDPRPYFAEITPEMAQALLDNNAENRDLKKDLVSRYQQDMEKDGWKQNGETIKICKDGTLMDGQHRLTAVVLENKPRKFVIVDNLEREVFSTIDIGRKRRLSDLLVIKGYKYSDKIAGAARLIGMLNQNKEFSRAQIKNRTQYTIDELYELIKSMPDMAADAELVMRRYPQLVQYIGSPVAIGLYCLFKEKDKSLTKELYEKLNKGHMLEANSVITHCRELLLAHRLESKTGRYINTSYLLYLMVKTWNTLRSNTYDTRLVTDHNLPVPVIS